MRVSSVVRAWASLLSACIAGCAARGPRVNPPAQSLPPPPVSTRASEAPPVIEPGVPAGACDIAGADLAVTTPVDLCGAPGRACFGRLADSYGLLVRSLRVAPSLAAHLVYQRGGVVVSAVIDGRAITPHPAQARLVADFFVPQWAAMAFEQADANEATLSVAPGDEVATTVSLVLHAPCTELTSDPPDISVAAIEALVHLGPPIAKLATSSVPFTLRTVWNGPVIARVSAPDREANVYQRKGRRARVVVAVDGGFVLGWLDESALGGPFVGGRRTHAPTLRMGVTVLGMECPHDVDVLASIDGDVVHAATIEAGTRFDPAKVAEVVQVGGVDLAEGVAVRVRDDADIADCTWR